MITRYTNGAEQDIDGVYRYSNGAEQLAEGVYRVINGAEQAIWNAIKYLVKKSNTIENGWGIVKDNGLTYSYSKWEDEGGKDGDISGSGELVLYLDGEWTNPEISFDWEGGYLRSSADMETWYTGYAGDIGIYFRKTDGTEDTTTVVTNIGTAGSGDWDYGMNTPLEKGTYTGILSGTYNRIGISIEPTGYSSAAGYWNASIDLYVSNLKFNGTKIAFPESAEFDYT